MRLLLCLSFQINFKFPHSKDVFFLPFAASARWRLEQRRTCGHSESSLGAATHGLIDHCSFPTRSSLSRTPRIWSKHWVVSTRFGQRERWTCNSLRTTLLGPSFEGPFDSKRTDTVHRTCTEICRGPCPRHSGHWRRIDFPGS